MYVRKSTTAAVHKLLIAGDDPNHEMLWIKYEQGCDVTFIGALYHPPVPIYQTTNPRDLIEAVILRIQLDFTGAHIILAGDLNQLSDTEVIVHNGI